MADKSGFHPKMVKKIRLSSILFPLNGIECKQEEGHYISHIPIFTNPESLYINAESLPYGKIDRNKYICYNRPVIVFGIEQSVRLAYYIASADNVIFVPQNYLVFQYTGKKVGVDLSYFLYYACLQMSFQNSSSQICHSEDTWQFSDLRIQFINIYCKIPSLEHQKKIIDGVNNMFFHEKCFLKEGTKLNNGRYIVEKTIGNGGFANTYVARVQAHPERLVAIKELFMKKYCYRDTASGKVVHFCDGDNEDYFNCAVKKFVGEVEKIRMCTSPNIIQVYDNFQENDTYYYVMEYLPGGSLYDRVRANKPLGEKKALQYIKGVANAVKEMHSKNMLHLDIKASNILVREDDTPVLIDFGATKIYDCWGTQCSHNPTVVSSENMPPEYNFSSGIVTFRPEVDIFQLGTTLQFLATGRVQMWDYQLKTFSSDTKVFLRQCLEQLEHRIKNIDIFLSMIDEIDMTKCLS